MQKHDNKNSDIVQIYENLKKWKNNSGGNSALLIDGARRVGKSFIVNEFAKNEYKSYITIDLDFFFNQMSLFFRIKLYKRESLMIFDEVKMYSKARN